MTQQRVNGQFFSVLLVDAYILLVLRLIEQSNSLFICDTYDSAPSCASENCHWTKRTVSRANNLLYLGDPLNNISRKERKRARCLSKQTLPSGSLQIKRKLTTNQSNPYGLSPNGSNMLRRRHADEGKIEVNWTLQANKHTEYDRMKKFPSFKHTKFIE